MSAVSVRAAFRAQLAGAEARREGLPVTACPYKVGGSAGDRVKARMWIRGYSRADMVLSNRERRDTNAAT